MIRTFQLSPRLQSIAKGIPRGAVIADVGTDHAYLPVWLLNEGIIDFAIACDLREGPLERARLTAARYGVSEKISLRLCDGLSGVTEDEATHITIAGMGGENMASIIDATDWLKGGNQVLLLQPMSGQEKLRHYLSSNGFLIEEEILSREGEMIYIALRVAPGDSVTYTQAECWIGKQTQEMVQPLRLAYIDQIVHKLVRALSGLSSAWVPEQVERQFEYKKVLNEIKVLREEWIYWQR